MKVEDMLPPEELSLFLKLHQHLLFYVAKQTGVNPSIKTVSDLVELSIDEKVKMRDALYKKMELLDRFIQSNPFNFTGEEMDIVKCWKHYVKGAFLLIKCTNEGAIFLEEKDRKDAKAYLVKAITTPFEQMIPFHPPVKLDAVLLPFKDRIVYDGLLKTYRVYIGGGLSRSLRAACDDAILKYGLVTSLPYTGDDKARYTDEEKLMYYLQTKERREEHFEKIEELLRKNPSLLPSYHREMGRSNSRRHVQLLREIGIEKGWFAIAGDTVIASGASREEVQKAVNNILPPDKRNAAYIFQLK